MEQSNFYYASLHHEACVVFLKLRSSIAFSSGSSPNPRDILYKTSFTDNWRFVQDNYHALYDGLKHASPKSQYYIERFFSDKTSLAGFFKVLVTLPPTAYYASFYIHIGRLQKLTNFIYNLPAYR